MEITYESLFNGSYDIEIKKILPKEVRGVLIGVHGFCGDKESSCMDYLAEKLEADGFGLVAFDFPEHGASRAHNQLTLANCKSDLLFVRDEVRRRYGAIPVIIFATSFGAFVSLCCVDEIADEGLIMRSPAIAMGEHTLLDFVGLSEEEFMRAGCVKRGYDRETTVTCDFYREMRAASIYSRHFEHEGLIILGDADNLIPLSEMEHFLSYNPQFVLKLVAGADHRYKHPGDLEAVLKYVKKYISQNYHIDMIR